MSELSPQDEPKGPSGPGPGEWIVLAFVVFLLTCPLWLWGLSSLTGGWYSP